MKRSSFARGKEAAARHAAKKARAAPLVPKATGRMNGRKDTAPLRDRAHAVRVASMPCAVCGLGGLTQAHHIREVLPRTMGVRVGDQYLMPLCVTHHAELHTVNNASFWRKYHIDAKRVAAGLYAATLLLREPTMKRYTPDVDFIAKLDRKPPVKYRRCKDCAGTGYTSRWLPAWSGICRKCRGAGLVGKQKET